MAKLQLPEVVLFDLDGTLLTSFAAVERCWARLAVEANLDSKLLKSLHGVPARQVLIQLLGEKRQSELDELCDRILDYECTDTAGVAPVNGAIQLLEQLDRHNSNWGIVTSCQTRLANARLAAAGLPIPELLVTVEQVTNGKPAPDPYLLGAQLAGVTPAQSVVVEDAPAGVQSGKAAGAFVVAVSQTHAASDLAQADLVLDNLAALHSVWF